MWQAVRPWRVAGSEAWREAGSEAGSEAVASLSTGLPFLPLLCVSVYCALGVFYGLALSYLLWCQYHQAPDGAAYADKNK